MVARYGDAAHALGDMYDDIRTIEAKLHHVIRGSLEERFGKPESGWWRAIPVTIRTKCQTRREEDTEPSAEPYLYTDLVDLTEIADKQWQS